MAAPLLPVIVQENWAQCENPNCNKWRRLPPGFEVKEDEPWYCYLNPDEHKATCSASEDEYNEATMVELAPTAADLDEAEHTRMIRQQLTGKLLASSGLPVGAALPPLPVMPAGGKGKGGRGRGRGKGRGKGRGGGGAAAAPGSQGDPYYQKRKSSGGPKYKEDSDEEFITDEEDLLPAAGPKVRHQAPAATYARHCARLLENQGSWEAARGHTTGGRAPPCMPPTAEAWEGLGQHAPELAEVAVAAADVASSLQYFEAAPDGEAAQAREAVDAVARLSTMLASAAALAATNGEGLTPEQRRACCLDAAAAVKQEPLAAAAAVSALPPHSLVLAGQPPGAAALPFAMPAPQQGAAALPFAMPAPQQGAPQLQAFQLPQPAAMFAQQQHMQGQQGQQPVGTLQQQQPAGLQIGAGMAQPAAAWPGMQLPLANGPQQQAGQQAMQQAFGMPQAMPQQFAGMMPQQQWAMPGLAMPGVGLPAGVTGATVQHYMQLLQQKQGGAQQPQANGTQH